jgi:chitinase
VYTTTTYTITSCKPEVTDCPARLGQVTTETVVAYTTVCPYSSKDELSLIKSTTTLSMTTTIHLARPTSTTAAVSYTSTGAKVVDTTVTVVPKPSADSYGPYASLPKNSTTTGSSPFGTKAVQVAGAPKGAANVLSLVAVVAAVAVGLAL